MSHHTFKLVIAGNGAVGKTALVHRHVSGAFNSNYVPTLGVEVTPMYFSSNYGRICFNTWDTAGQEKYGGLQDGYFIGADCAILMFDVTNKESYRAIKDWYKKVVNVAGDIPMVICGNKVDMNAERVIMPEHIRIHRELNLPYYDISSKSNYNFEKPFLSLARRLTGYGDLEF